MDEVVFLESMNLNNINCSDICTTYLDEFILLYDLINFADSVSVLNNSIKSITFAINSNSIIDIKSKLDYQSIFIPFEKQINVRYNIASSNEIIIYMNS